MQARAERAERAGAGAGHGGAGSGAAQQGSLSASGDPIFSYKGIRTKFNLPPRKLTTLMTWVAPGTGALMELAASTFTGPHQSLEHQENGLPYQSWFERFLVRADQP